MKSLLTLFVALLVSQIAISGGEPVASDATLKKALANPNQYRIDDGGGIDFGNGFYKRRFNFSGRPQACHQGNYLYAGMSEKCVKPILNSDGDIVGCNAFSKVELKTIMVGVRKVCVSNDDDSSSDACSKYSTVKVNRGPQVKVAVYSKAQMSSKDPNAGLLGYNYLTLPACKN